MEVHRLIMDIQTWTLKAHECTPQKLIVCNQVFGLSPKSADPLMKRLDTNKKKDMSCVTYPLSILLSLLSDSNQRPRDYKSRALAN